MEIKCNLIVCVCMCVFAIYSIHSSSPSPRIQPPLVVTITVQASHLLAAAVAAVTSAFTIAVVITL